jgi:hypothetical protein
VVIVAAIITALAVFAIAAGAVGREAHLLDAVPARPVFDPDEATTWIAERLPPQTTAALSYAEVGGIVNATLDLLRSRAGVARTSGEVPDAGAEVVVDEDAAVAHAAGSLPVEHVRPVVQAVFSYLEVIGAVGPVKDD